VVSVLSNTGKCYKTTSVHWQTKLHSILLTCTFTVYIIHQYIYTDTTIDNWLKLKLKSWFDQFTVLLLNPNTRRREALRRSISKANVIGVLHTYSIKFIFIHLFLLPIANDCSRRSQYHNRLHHENQHIRDKHDDTNT